MRGDDLEGDNSEKTRDNQSRRTSSCPHHKLLTRMVPGCEISKGRGAIFTFQQKYQSLIRVVDIRFDNRPDSETGRW